MFGLSFVMTLTVSSPCNPGIFMSIKTMSMFSFMAISIASVPERAVKTFVESAKFLFIIKERESITICSSSVSNMLNMVWNPYNKFCSQTAFSFCYIKKVGAVELKL